MSKKFLSLIEAIGRNELFELHHGREKREREDAARIQELHYVNLKKLAQLSEYAQLAKIEREKQRILTERAQRKFGGKKVDWDEFLGDNKGKSNKFKVDTEEAVDYVDSLLNIGKPDGTPNKVRKYGKKTRREISKERREYERRFVEKG